MRPLEQQVAELSHRAPVDPEHKRRLRDELLRRHQELTAGRSQRAAGTLWARTWRPTRLTLVAPAALAATSVLMLLATAFQLLAGTLWVPSPQSVQASQLTGALVRSAPTVTGWEMTLQQVRDDQAATFQCIQPLRPGQHLYIRGNRSYLFAAGRWYEVTGTWYRVSPGRTGRQCPSDWEWAFAVLPSHLAQQGFEFVWNRLDRNVIGVHYTLQQSRGSRVEATAWVDRTSGLVRRLERDVVQAGRVVERDVASFRYTRTP
jgi:hypothetical protein